MPDTTPSFGGGVDEKIDPRTFMKQVRLYFLSHSYTDEKAKVMDFALFLETDSEAKKWYEDDLTAAEKVDFQALEKAFRARFPHTPKAKRTAAEIERELIEMRLGTDELGSKDADGMYTHVTFAEKLVKLARAANIHTTTSSIVTICENLPRIIRQKIAETQKDWEAFTKAIKDIELAHIRDGLEDEKERKKDKEKLEQLEARLQQAQNATSPPGTPSKALARSFANTSLQLPAQPFRGFRPSYNSTQRTFQTSSLTETQRATLQANVSVLVHHPNTPEGFAAYRKQLADWAAKWGKDQLVTYQTPFPLTPGTSPVCSNECFKCGKHGHRGIDCMESSHIPPKENDWRRLCRRELRTTKTTPVHWVNDDSDEDMSWLYTRGFDRYGQQGKGEGSSA